MRYALFFALVALLATPAIAQTESGIFLTVPCGKGSARQKVMLTLKPVCIAANPMILTSAFESVTEINRVNERIFFDLKLSQKAVGTLRQLAKNLPDATFALVVEKEVFSVFPASNLDVNRTFRFLGDVKDDRTFSTIQEKLKALIPEVTQ